MEGHKNNLFFVGENRFKYYIIEPLNELIPVFNTGINNYYWNPNILQIPTQYTDKQQIDYINNEYDKNFKTLNIKPIEIKNIKYQDILYLTFEKYNENDDEKYNDTYKVPYECDFVNNWVSPYYKNINNTNINNLIRLKSNIQTDLINVNGTYEKQNMDIVIPISIFENIFKTHSKIDISKLPLTCYFAIVSSNLDNAISLSNNLKDLLYQFPQPLIDNVLISDVKEYHNFAGSFLSNMCFNDNDNNEEYDIIKYFNNIYVLPCLHEIKGKAGNIASYWDVNTDCRYEPDKDNKTNDTLKKNCTHIEADNCDSQRAIQHYEIDWSIYLNFYNGYRDEKKNTRQKCRYNNFLGLFFFAFVRDVNASGGKKYRKSRKLRRSRKYKKHKSRKYKSRK
jgi:hypothetical protein